MPVQPPPILKVTGHLEELVSRNDSSFSILQEDELYLVIAYNLNRCSCKTVFSFCPKNSPAGTNISYSRRHRTPFLHTSTISSVQSILVVGSPFTRRRSAFSPGAILPRSPRRKRLALTEVADLSASTGERPHRYTYRDSSW